MNLERDLSKRLKLQYNGVDYLIIDKELVEDPLHEATLARLTQEEAWLLKLWIGDLKSLWQMENMNTYEVAPIKELLYDLKGHDQIDRMLDPKEPEPDGKDE